MWEMDAASQHAALCVCACFSREGETDFSVGGDFSVSGVSGVSGRTATVLARQGFLLETKRLSPSPRHSGFNFALHELGMCTEVGPR